MTFVLVIVLWLNGHAQASVQVYPTPDACLTAGMNIMGEAMDSGQFDGARAQCLSASNPATEQKAGP